MAYSKKIKLPNGKSIIRETYNSAGIKIEEAHIENDQLHGQYRRWYSNGNISFEMFYKHGDSHGDHILYDAYSKRLQCSYHEGKLHGNYKYWNQEGKLLSDIDYVMGYEKKKIMIILKYLRKAKLYRFARLIKTKAFIEWWYSPEGPGGKRHKKKMQVFCNNLMH